MGCGSEDFTLEAIKAGARGVLPVTAPLRVALAAIRLVLAGGIYYLPRLPSAVLSTTDAVPEGQRSSPRPPPLTHGSGAGPSPPMNRAAITGNQTAHFTARELDVLAGLQKGRSNKWIARQLNLSENTVKVHITHIMRKLKATNRTQAMIYSQSQGPAASHRDADALRSGAS
jgi:DNA-binding NarL/FixJ family response regulator